jgi:DNA-binding NtrC family response regulator
VPEPLWLERNRLMLGRDASCEVVLSSHRVSRRHAQLLRSGPLWLLSDLGSKNGVFINGERAQKAALTPGDVLRIGDHVAVFMEAPRDADLSFGLVAPGIFGGRAHREVVARARAAARSTVSIVLVGETGTGKERFSEAIHGWSGRTGPLVAVNCATYTRALAAGELFGYRKGAFTGADRASAGHLRAAHLGTLFLDEVLELPLDVQAMLLRAVENREVLALGESMATPVDVRFLSAGQVALGRAVAEGRFRADLHARLSGEEIRLPSLASCREIVPELFAVLFEQACGRAPSLTAAAAERLCLHDWPLNVRELETVVRRAILAGAAEETDLTSFLSLPSQTPSSSRTADAGGVSGGSAKGRASLPGVAVPGRKSVEAAYAKDDLLALVDALAAHSGNLTRAAAALGVSRPRAYRMLEVATRAGLVS